MNTEIRTRTSIVIVALLLLAAPAMAEPAPFVITGHVYDFCGDPCNGSWVQITNTNTGTSWNAENSSESNYYRLVLDSDDVNAGNVLEIEASGCSRSNTTEHTVSESEVDNGGFELNITLEPIIISCDSAGNEKNEFCTGENVSVTGTGLASNTQYKIWIQLDPVGEGDLLVGTEDPSGAQETVTTDSSGNFGPIEIWSNIPEGSQMNYDIVVDNQDGTYNAASDGIDSASTYGIVAPVPELASVILFAVGLVMLLGIMRFGRRE